MKGTEIVVVFFGGEGSKMLSLFYTKADNFSLSVCLIASTASSHLFLACFKVFETFHYNITVNCESVVWTQGQTIFMEDFLRKKIMNERS